MALPLLALHVPPVTVDERVVDADSSTVVAPDTVPADGVASMVTTRVAVAVPQLLVTA